MRNAMIIALVVCLSSLQLSTGGGKDKDQKRLQGTWKVVKIDAGPKGPPPSKMTILMIFKKNNFTIKNNGQVQTAGTFTIDSAKSPAQIDLKITEAKAPLEGKTAHGIYKFEKKQLQICIGQPGEQRPAKFKGDSERRHSHVFLEIQK